MNQIELVITTKRTPEDHNEVYNTLRTLGFNVLYGHSDIDSVVFGIATPIDARSVECIIKTIRCVIDVHITPAYYSAKHLINKFDASMGNNKATKPNIERAAPAKTSYTEPAKIDAGKLVDQTLEEIAKIIEEPLVEQIKDLHGVTLEAQLADKPHKIIPTKVEEEAEIVQPSNWNSAKETATDYAAPAEATVVPQTKEQVIESHGVTLEAQAIDKPHDKAPTKREESLEIIQPSSWESAPETAQSYVKSNTINVFNIELTNNKQ